MELSHYTATPAVQTHCSVRVQSCEHLGNKIQVGTVFTTAATPDFYSSLSCATSNDVSHSSSFHTDPQSAATPHAELLPKVASP